ncbi:hypothetical protein E3N88_12158 [Mikania micrantha]|uniref:Uncharacterized protein n=1 Tax=Mikania micrantha TaxID=192012 RepID=A0A5N6P4V2_9ASTR|nr:hypothetical protein E3N88_12158 [Mikania micrantha]
MEPIQGHDAPLAIWARSKTTMSVHKVPAIEMETLGSPLMGLFEKHFASKYFIYVQGYDYDYPKSQSSVMLRNPTSMHENRTPKGKFIAFVTTVAKTENPETGLKPGIDLLGPVDQIFFDTYTDTIH